MRFTIIKSENRINVDGLSRSVDLSDLNDNVHVVQWRTSEGHIEFVDHSPQQFFTDITPWLPYIALWDAAAPPPPTFAELKAAKRAEFRLETIVRMSAQVSAWNSFERIEFLMSISNMLNTGSMTPEQILAKNILLFAKNTAIPKVNAISTENALSTIDPTLSYPFGDGTVWPT